VKRKAATASAAKPTASMRIVLNELSSCYTALAKSYKVLSEKDKLIAALSTELAWFKEVEERRITELAQLVKPKPRDPMSMRAGPVLIESIEPGVNDLKTRLRNTAETCP
jgi:hypothetical protein